ncbi:MAG: hypothetical protein ACOVRN_14760 [Flavobacterium sp.]
MNIAEMNQYINASIYIPRVSVFYSETDIRRVLWSHGIQGIVSMDFTPIHKKPGFRENIGKYDQYMSVFIHFFDEEEFRRPTNQAFWTAIFNDQSYRVVVNVNEYWICLRNKNPVPRTWMNLHQVVENGRYLEGLVESQHTLIQDQERRIQMLETKLDCLTDTVYQLVGGLYNQSTQPNCLKNHVNVLLHGLYSNQTIQDKSPWGSWPTTRQGDYCERRLNKLDALLNVDTKKAGLNPEDAEHVQMEYEQLNRDEEAIRQHLSVAITSQNKGEQQMIEDELELIRAEKKALREDFKNVADESLQKALFGEDESTGSVESYECV